MRTTLAAIVLTLVASVAQAQPRLNVTELAADVPYNYVDTRPDGSFVLTGWKLFAVTPSGDVVTMDLGRLPVVDGQLRVSVAGEFQRKVKEDASYDVFLTVYSTEHGRFLSESAPSNSLNLLWTCKLIDVTECIGENERPGILKRILDGLRRLFHL